MTRQHILDEIRRTAAANDGKPLGWRMFEKQTGIRYADWFGKYWKGWGDALAEAGFTPNTLTRRISDDELLARYLGLARELGRIPVKGELRLKRKSDPTFPNDKVFARYGLKAEFNARLLDFCAGHSEFADLTALFATGGPVPREAELEPRSKTASDGFVYLLRSGQFYKLGRTNAFGRRERELAIQLPQKPNTVHTIKTDDPQGIEAYWHARFASKRAHGEWFRLTPADVAAFKRRRFM